MSVIQRTSRRVKAVHGSCRWVKRIVPPSPGILEINGAPYLVIPLKPAGYRLVYSQAGKASA